MDSRLKPPENISKGINFLAKEMKSSCLIGYIHTCSPSLSDISSSFKYKVFSDSQDDN